MKLGARIFKTGIAVILALYIAKWLHFDMIIFAAISAVLSTQPSIYKSLKHMTEYVKANIIGALIGVIAIFTLGQSPIILGIVVMLVISINLLLKFDQAITVSIVTAVAIMQIPQGASHYAVDRFLLIMIGIFSSVFVNIFFIPPKYENRVIAQIKKANEKLATLMRNVSDSAYEEKAFRKDKSELIKLIEEAEKLFSFYREERVTIKHDRLKLRKTVVFKQMIRTLDKNLEVVKSIGRQDMIDREDKFNEHIFNLLTYHEKIMLKFEGKIKANHPHEVSSIILEGNDALSKHNSKDKHGYILTARLMEAYDQIERLDKLIDSFHSFHNEKKEE